MDYLVRDAHHTGVPYGTIDHGRLRRELTFVDGELVLAEGNVQTAESLLLARALMNPTVYQHHVARIGKAMLRRATGRLLREADYDAGTVRRWDDADLLSTLRRTDAATDFADRLSTRDLFKRAVWAELTDVPEDLLEADHERIRHLEAEVAATVDLDPDSVIVDVPPPPAIRESSSRVVVNGEIRRLDKQSPLVNALRVAGRNQWRLGVYAPERAVDRVGRAAVRTLGLDVDGAPISDVRGGLDTTLDEFE
jgi:HD superfamily phosphohydrolase